MSFHLHVPLVGEKGYVSRIYKRTPRHIPRLNETIYLGVYLGYGLDSKVANVNYSGHDLNTIRIELEPIPAKYLEALLKKPSKLALKRYSEWMYFDGNRYQDIETILD